MSDRQKIETDELISLYLDGEASQRQRTELKRLVQHDRSIGDKLKALQKQQRLLGAMPVESAPASMIDDIRTAMERKLILGDSDQSGETVASSSHLMMRRLLTAAAMLLIPLGLLSAVVYQIVKPASQDEVRYVDADSRVVDRPSETGEAVPREVQLIQLPFNGSLILTTDEYMTVSSQIEKAIFDEGLLDHTLPSRTADVTSFHITATPKMIADLIDSLNETWGRCKAVSLEVVGQSGTVCISDPQSRQIKTLVYEDNVEMLDHLAGRYAAANQKAETMFAEKTDGDGSALSENGYPPVSIPTLAGNYDQARATIQLSIHVERNLK